MDTLFTALIFGNLWFSLISAVWLILLIYLVEKDHSCFSGLSILLYFLFLNFIVKKDIIGYVIHNPIKIMFFLIGYIVIGFIWSCLKWWLFVNKKVIEYKHIRYEWLTERIEKMATKLNSIPDELKKITIETEVPEYLLKDWAVAYKIDKPDIYLYKHKISHWIAYWPFSMFWSIIEDFIGKVMRIIVMKMRFIYESITNSAFKNTSDIDWK